MAILKGVEVTIRSEGRTLTEYDPGEDDTAEGSSADERLKYVESQPGSKFYIFVKSRLGPHTINSWSSKVAGISVSVALDGEKRQGIVSKCDIGEEIRYAYSTENGIHYRRAFQFSEIHTTEDNSSNPSLFKLFAASASSLGSITVTIRRVSGWGNETLHNYPVQAGEIRNIPEKALKGSAVSHCSTLGHPQITPHGRRLVQTNFIDPRDKPWAVFHFRYRSHSALQIEGIIPRDPSPSKESTAKAGNALAEYSTEDLRRILQKREEADKPQPKCEHLGLKSEARRGASVKRERDPDVEILSESRRRKRRVEVEVIDLSGD